MNLLTLFRLLLTSAVVILSSGGTVLAHAILVQSEPALNASVPRGQQTLELRFNSRIDHARSRLLLIRPDRSETVLAIDSDAPENVLKAPADLTPGLYTVRWQVLALDGHITRGDLPFTVTDH